ncbi:UNVERIFIED_CONTAM: hypothetical protein Scaly_2113900 [Sesamum calycinum]|uniref:Uncharacterized protein n=1 Tax=Sesamum calycinum TaxID=2727403 RepID=A0AAW2MMP5_9LAMI
MGENEISSVGKVQKDASKVASEGGEKEEKFQTVMEGVASIALLPMDPFQAILFSFLTPYAMASMALFLGFLHFSVLLSLYLVGCGDSLTKRERDIVVECRGHDAAKICSTDHAHGWQKDVVGMLEQKHGKHKVSVSFECETLKAEKAAEEHLRKFMPKLVGMDAVVFFSLDKKPIFAVNIGHMTIAGLDFDAETECERIEQSS